MLVLVAHQVHLVEHKDHFILPGIFELLPELIEAPASGVQAQQMGHDLEAGVVLAAVNVGELQAPVVSQGPHEIAGQNAFARTSGAKDQDIIGDPGLFIPQQRIDDRLDFLPHQGFVGNEVEIKNPEIPDTFAAVVEVFLSLAEILFDIHLDAFTVPNV